MHLSAEAQTEGWMPQPQQLPQPLESESLSVMKHARPILGTLLKRFSLIWSAIRQALKAQITSLVILMLILLIKDAQADTRPNIVFVFSDDHATQAISAYGFDIGKYAPTPNLDRIAQQGMRFDRCMVTNSICGPSRATILTGKYSHLNGFYYNEETQFDGSQVTFPKLLREAGYQTAVIGKWHLASEPTGFDHWEILPGQGSYYKPDFITSSGRITEDGYVTNVITDKAIDWIENQRDPEKPFMLMVQHKAPHREWSPEAKYLGLFSDVDFPLPKTFFDDYRGRTTAAHAQDMSINETLEEDRDLKVAEPLEDTILYKRVYSKLTEDERRIWDQHLQLRREEYRDPNLKGIRLKVWKYQIYIKDYLRCLRSLDDNIGRLQEYLETSGLAENTVFIYSSDQGFYLGEHGWFDKRFMYDESYRTPLLVSWPGVIKPGSVSTDIVSNLDFAQTFLDIAETPGDPEMQGKSLLPILKGDSTGTFRDYHYYHYYEYPGWHMVMRHEGVYDGRYKLIHFYDVDEWELIDMETDPHELQNQYFNPEYADVVKRMTVALGRVKEKYKVTAGIPTPRDIEDPSWYYFEERREKERLMPSF